MKVFMLYEWQPKCCCNDGYDDKLLYVFKYKKDANKKLKAFKAEAKELGYESDELWYEIQEHEMI